MYSGVVKTQKPLSAKICLNLNFFGGERFWGSQNSMCQVLAKFSFLGEGGILDQIPEYGKLGFLNTKSSYSRSFQSSLAVHHR